jgi:hypothetical protein
MPASADNTPAPRRLRRTIILVAVAFVVAIATPVISISVLTPHFLETSARLLAPWDASVADWSTGAPGTAVSADSAGEALRRLMGDRNTSDNIVMRMAQQVEMPSLDSTPAGLFADARDPSRGGLDWTKALIVARRRLTPAERAYLASIAASPIWKDWDVLARSRSLDILAARVELPFREHATTMELPLMRLMTLNNAGRLSGVRAAHFIAAGRRDSAEAAVHSALAVGLLIDREATNILEAWMGRRLIFMATTLSNGLRGDSMTTDVPRIERDSLVRTLDESRAVLVAIASDSTAHRAARFEALMNLGMVPCTNARELLFGFRSDVAGAFASARRNLVRHPSDSALLDLMEFSSERSPDLHEDGVLAAAFREMAHLSSKVLFNKRIHGCGEMLPYLRMQ